MLLESMASSDAVCLRELTAQLSAEHRELETDWQRLRLELERIIANPSASLSASDVESLRRTVRAAYRA